MYYLKAILVSINNILSNKLTRILRKIKELCVTRVLVRVEFAEVVALFAKLNLGNE